MSTVISNPRWESYEPTSGNGKPLPRAGHVSVTTEDRIIMFVPLLPSPSPLIIIFFVDLVVMTVDISLTTLGRLTFLRENGPSYNALGPFRPPVKHMLLSSSIMLCMSLVGVTPMKPY